MPHACRNILLLGLAQLLAWGSTYYLAALLAPAMAADLGLSSALVFGLFSVALIVSAATGPVAGAAIDRLGGRGVLMAASLIFAAALMLMAQSSSALGLAAGWMLLGLGMGAGLYEGAFATLVQLYGMQSRRPTTAITLIAGLASTVCWPVTAWLLATLGWRETCMVWAGVHVLINLPLYAGLRKPVAQTDAAQPRARPPDLPLAPPVQGAESITPGPIAQGPATPALARRITALLALSFALTWFISTALAAHLPQLLEAQGLSPAMALAFAALVGVAQVGGRLLEFALQQKISSLQSARLAAALHPIGATAFLLLGTPAVFTVLHGAGNGILTIAKGTLPLQFFGPAGYGLRQGLIMVPARFAQALAPLSFGLALQAWGAQALWLCVGLGLACLAALMALPRPGALP